MLQKDLKPFVQKVIDERVNKKFFSHVPSKLPSEYKGSTPKFVPINDKPVLLSFNLHEMGQVPLVASRMDMVLQSGVSYTAFVKIKLTDGKHFMCGNQFSFECQKGRPTKLIVERMIENIGSTLAEYGVNEHEEVLAVDIIMRIIIPELRFNLGISTNVFEGLTKSESFDLVKESAIPVNFDVGDSATKLVPEFDENGKIKHLRSNIIKHDSIEDGDFYSKISNNVKYLKPNLQNQIQNFDNTWDYFYLKLSNGSQILISKFDGFQKAERFLFSLSGHLKTNFVDSILPNKKVIRSNEKSVITIVDNNIVHYRKRVPIQRLPSVNKSKRDLAPVSDGNIGVFDCETFRDNDGSHKVYAVGFKTNLDSDVKTFYVNENTMDFEQPIIEMINEMFRSKYSDITKFYCHNSSNYDIIFLIKVLNDFNKNNGVKYILNPFFRDGKIICLDIELFDHKPKRKISLVDSYCLLDKSLYTLGIEFGVDTIKGTFPYEFGRRNTLFYKGITPDYVYYDKTRISIDEYNKLVVNNWDFKQESLNYLKDDVISLLQVISKANKQVFEDYHVNMIDSLTISSLAIKLFMSQFYKENLPCINKTSVYNTIKKAYYGGITEVYIPYGENLYYYDVNSLYPYVALENDFPGASCNWEVFKNKNDAKGLFGFYECVVEAPLNNYLGVLPVRSDSGLYFPNGSWTGWYFSEEIKYAIEKWGYKVNILKGYSFSRESNVFTDYINKVYKFKQNPINSTQKSMAKSLLNNLLGRFGIRLDANVTKIVDRDEFDKISLIHSIKDYKVLGETDYLVTYNPSLNPDLIQNNKLDYVKVSEKVKTTEKQSRRYTSITTSAAVTAYARIHMCEMKRKILLNGGKIYYSDTDSIVTDIELPDSLISPGEIGKLKLEHKVKKGIFISGKTYALIDSNNNHIIKAKGVDKSSLTFKDFEDLLNNKDVNASKTQSKTYWSEGFVSIDTTEVVISSDSFKRRTKIFDTNDVWVNTKPVVLYDSTLKSEKENFSTKVFKEISVVMLAFIFITLYTINLFVDEDNDLSGTDTSDLICTSKTDETINNNSNFENKLVPREKRLLEIDEGWSEESSEYKENIDESGYGLSREMRIKYNTDRWFLHDDDFLKKRREDPEYMENFKWASVGKPPKYVDCYTYYYTGYNTPHDTRNEENLHWLAKDDDYHLSSLFESENKGLPPKEDSLNDIYKLYNDEK